MYFCYCIFQWVLLEDKKPYILEHAIVLSEFKSVNLLQCSHVIPRTCLAVSLFDFLTEFSHQIHRIVITLIIMMIIIAWSFNQDRIIMIIQVQLFNQERSLL